MGQDQKKKDVLRILFLGSLAFGGAGLIFWAQSQPKTESPSEGPVQDGEPRPIAIEASAAEEALVPLEQRLQNPQLIAEGKTLYQLHCVACHGQRGEGATGPNLADRHWIHGGALENIVGTIAVGVPAKGMIAWEPSLGKSKVEALAAFVWSLQGTNPPQAKGPEGDEY
jgi:mono/diheme cytochrome c family protein